MALDVLMQHSCFEFARAETPVLHSFLVWLIRSASCYSRLLIARDIEQLIVEKSPRFLLPPFAVSLKYLDYVSSNRGDGHVVCYTLNSD